MNTMNLKGFTIAFMVCYIMLSIMLRYSGVVLGAEQVVLSTAFTIYLLFQIPRKRKKSNM